MQALKLYLHRPRSMPLCQVTPCSSRASLGASQMQPVSILGSFADAGNLPALGSGNAAFHFRNIAVSVRPCYEEIFITLQPGNPAHQALPKSAALLSSSCCS